MLHLIVFLYFLSLKLLNFAAGVAGHAGWDGLGRDVFPILLLFPATRYLNYCFSSILHCPSLSLFLSLELLYIRAHSEGNCCCAEY